MAQGGPGALEQAAGVAPSPGAGAGTFELEAWGRPHWQACPTSRRGLRRLGSKPSVEYIYTTVDMAAVQLNIYPWIHGTSRLRKDGLRRTNGFLGWSSYTCRN